MCVNSMWMQCDNGWLLIIVIDISLVPVIESMRIKTRSTAATHTHNIFCRWWPVMFMCSPSLLFALSRLIRVVNSALFPRPLSFSHDVICASTTVSKLLHFLLHSVCMHLCVKCLCGMACFVKFIVDFFWRKWDFYCCFCCCCFVELWFVAAVCCLHSFPRFTVQYRLLAANDWMFDKYLLDRIHIAQHTHTHRQ